MDIFKGDGVLNIRRGLENDQAFLDGLICSERSVFWAKYLCNVRVNCFSKRHVPTGPCQASVNTLMVTVVIQVLCFIIYLSTYPNKNDGNIWKWGFRVKAKAAIKRNPHTRHELPRYKQQDINWSIYRLPQGVGNSTFGRLQWIINNISNVHMTSCCKILILTITYPYHYILNKFHVHF